ncbi:MAG: bifunctional phosphoribosylaminoimidazolecarboxamide formyltransferase/IMP cyclohydrolase [Chitinophagaceae bacterium]
MQKQIKSALISVFNKEGLENIVKQLHQLGITIYSTGGTQKFIEQQHVPCKTVEELTDYPSILGGRVKTLHPKVFGGILSRRENPQDSEQLKQFGIPEIDLVIVDLYPFEDTVASTSEEQKIIEKIDIGGVSLIRAAGKNYKDVLVIASKEQYADLEKILTGNNAETSLEERRKFASFAFELCAHYDVVIADFFTEKEKKNYFLSSATPEYPLRYGENPHQQAAFYGKIEDVFEQLHGKTLSYNNLVDVDAAVRLVQEFGEKEKVFAVIKHTNPCGIAIRPTLKEAWDAALAGDRESAFGGVLVCNTTMDKETAETISKMFFEVLIAKDFSSEALDILLKLKNKILLKQLKPLPSGTLFKNVLNGVLVQDVDNGNFSEWKEVAGQVAEAEKEDLIFANLVCKHLKSNAIALIKNKQLIGKGAGQTSRVDALRHAIDKAKQFNFDLHGAVMASDAFFPFDDCVSIAHEAGITAVIQPGGSVRDKDSIAFCRQHNMAMVMTGIRHFKH